MEHCSFSFSFLPNVACCPGLAQSLPIPVNVQTVVLAQSVVPAAGTACLSLSFPCPDSFLVLQSMGTSPMYLDSATFGLLSTSRLLASGHFRLFHENKSLDSNLFRHCQKKVEVILLITPIVFARRFGHYIQTAGSCPFETIVTIGQMHRRLQRKNASQKTGPDRHLLQDAPVRICEVCKVADNPLQ